ncbi:uncharacterized protein LOC123541280 [Mercenaria mercenaria]|uniref:uncharacterized protein LOC123541280 n=1 Tax=Mercenaria mercenaria TaxID=6596 RepID=UPI00234F86B5|nr:uncharacterized protein LOC123541280 [Mercenaria mercenaria]
MANSTQDQDHLLSDLNDEEAKLFIPVILYVGILMLIGTIGNFMVVYFYGCKSKASPSVSFIFTLAIFDLVTCVIGMPMEIADLRYFFNFRSELACKILRCVTYFASISSGFTLVAIAIDRYRRICKPFERQLNNKHVKVACVGTGILSLLLSWPAIVFNEVVDVEIVNKDGITVIGKDCTTTKRDDYRPFMLAFNIVYLVAFTLVTLILAVLYAFVSRQLFRHKKFRSYVAKGSTSVKRITVMSNYDSDENLLPPRETSTLSNRVFEDPPDASGSVVDMKEFVTRGLTQVEHDRPTSGYTAITGTTGLTGLTDLSGKSRGTLHSTKSMKSVTICDPSQNQIFPIEAREVLRPSSSRSQSEWKRNVGNRPGTASSFATFSSRPSSAALSSVSEFSKVTHRNGNDVNQKLDNEYEGSNTDGDQENIEAANEVHEQSGEESDGRVSIRIFEHDIDGETVTVTDETVSSLDETFMESGENTKSKRPVNDLDENIDTASVNNIDDVGDESKDFENTDAATENNIDDIGDTSKYFEAKDIEQEKSETTRITEVKRSERPPSTQSSKSSKSMSSYISKRSNVVTPLSKVTMTSSVGSRASTVKRIKRLLHGNVFKNAKMNTDTDKVKELRMKMLDISTVKYTVIMLVITIVFVFSFLPYLALVIWRYIEDDHEVNFMSDTGLVFFQIGIRSIFLNSSLNPVIYGGFNSKFRAFFYDTCCSCCMTPKRKRKKRTQSRDHSDSTSGT